jgi:predicted nucleotidyltransferase
MIIEIKNTEFYIFGSYLRTLKFNDIDVLIVVPKVSDLRGINEYLALLEGEYPHSLVHTHLYLQSEYLNPKNKFSYKKVSNKISPEEFLELFKIEQRSF